jgi:hypothetical protein
VRLTIAVSKVILNIKNEHISVNDFYFPGNMDGSERTVTSDHDTLGPNFSLGTMSMENYLTYSVGRVSEHLQRIDSIIFKRTMKDQESSKVKTTLDVFAREFIDLRVSVIHDQRCNCFGEYNTLSMLIGSISLEPSANTRLPFLVNDL